MPYGLISAAMTPDLHKLILDRLQQQGVNVNEVPALLRDMTNILESNPGIDLARQTRNLNCWGGTS